MEIRCSDGTTKAPDFSRNLGLLTSDQQGILQKSRVAVCGVGGMGAVAAESLARIGIGSLTISDQDCLEETDINRHPHCTRQTIGRAKVSVVAEKLRDINGSLELCCFTALNQHNVCDVIEGVDVVVNGMDQVQASIILEREARRQGRPIVDAWLTPYASVLVMTPDAPHWEEFLSFPTVGKEVHEITESDIQQCLRQEVRFTLAQFRPYEIVTRQLVEDVLAGTVPRPSLLPVVWLSGVLMANEVVKVLTSQGRLASHWGVFYNHYDHEVRFFHSNENPLHGHEN